VTTVPALEALGERVEVHDRVLAAEQVVEAALRHARCSGIWPPSKPRLNL
jgi:hypothetical protein